MRAPDRRIRIAIHLDANRINSKGKLPYVNALERLVAAGVVDVLMSETAQAEAARGSDPRRQKKAFGYISAEPAITTAAEEDRFRRIEATIFPDGADTRAKRNDVNIVFTAGKYHAVLVTADGDSNAQPRGILGSREDLANLGITVMTDRELLEFLGEKIAGRDRLAREFSQATGEPLPDWVGSDSAQVSL